MTNGFLAPEEKEFHRRYAISLWWVEHRVLLKRLGYGIFIAGDFLLIVFVAWSMLSAFVLSDNRDRSGAAALGAQVQSDLHTYTLQHVAKPLEQSTVIVLANGTGHYDVYTELTNANDDWYAEFVYSFTSSAGQTEKQNGFILPGESRPLFVLSASAAPLPRTATLLLEDVRWQRVDHHTIGDYRSWHDERFNITAADVVWTPAVGIAGEVGRITFTVENQSAYSYYDVIFVIVLRRGATVVGVTRATLAALDSGEMRPVSVNWFDAPPAVSKVEVTPLLNLFDINVYKPLAGETPSDLRERVLRR